MFGVRLLQIEFRIEFSYIFGYILFPISANFGLSSRIQPRGNIFSTFSIVQKLPIDNYQLHCRIGKRQVFETSPLIKYSCRYNKCKLIITAQELVVHTSGETMKNRWKNIDHCMGRYFAFRYEMENNWRRYFEKVRELEEENKELRKLVEQKAEFESSRVIARMKMDREFPMNSNP